jgi:hypothetical protein
MLTKCTAAAAAAAVRSSAGKVHFQRNWLLQQVQHEHAAVLGTFSFTVLVTST